MKFLLMVCFSLLLETSCGYEDQLLNEELLAALGADPIGTSNLEYKSIIVDEDTILLMPVVPFSYATAQGGPGDNTPVNNPITDTGAALGKVLFYDRQLSLNHTRSCGSCHIQSKGFADGLALSEGFAGELTKRNSMSLANSRFYENGRFFWDERALTLEEQVLMPIQDEREMGLNLEEAVARISSSDYYVDLFIAAFGDSVVNSDRISLALAQFVRSLDSFGSHFDQVSGPRRPGRGGPPGPGQGLSELEEQGRRLFFSRRTNCARCHEGRALAADQARNNGLPILNEDFGKALATSDANEVNKFKVPSLKNIEVTGPYMHDGRFESLEEVVEHYNSGVVASGNLDNRLRLALGLNDGEKAALVAFMKTFTDHLFLNDPRFSDPFQRSK